MKNNCGNFWISAFAQMCAVTIVGTALGTPAQVVPCTGDCTRLSLNSGVIEGKLRKEQGVVHFLGVPFAKPPVGSLRWQPPEPPEVWDGVRKTQKYSNACMQSPSDVYGDFASGVSEDCLYLNMWIPERASTSGVATFPIMIFWHGGSYVSGSAMIPVYGGDADVRAHKDVILIAANYRLGWAGFLASDHLRATDNSTGNFGLQDQRIVMEWARDNAAAFHGDPNRITIFGESAGAGSVSNHMVAPKSAGLFHAAIMESGPIAAQWVAAPLEIAENQFQALARSLNCVAGGAISQADCLRAVNASVLHAHRPHCNGAEVNWSPTVDGVELMAEPRVLLAQGKAHDVPVIIGTNRDEGTIFIDFPMDGNNTQYAQFMAANFGPTLGPEILQQYPTNRFNATKDASAAWWATSTVFGDAAMTCAAHHTARKLVMSPGRNSPVYKYYWQHELDLLKTIDFVQKTHAFGCCHASELPLVFDIDEVLFGKGERDIASMVVKWWQELASNGSLTGWPAWSATSNISLVWDVVNDKAVINPDTIKQADCDWWDAHLALVPNEFSWGACAYNSTLAQ